jgi:peptidoglycan/LPS O-acetylase OafA/YrhL
VEKDKLLSLEILRFFCSLAVLVFHYQFFSYLNYRKFNFHVTEAPYYSFLSIFYNYGNYAVMVFFSISGFIFYWKYSNKISNKEIDFKKYFIFRFSRLYPLHLLTLLIVLAFQYLYQSNSPSFFVYPKNDLYHFLLQIFMASEWGFQKGHSFNGPIWSVSAEMLIYGVFFFGIKRFGVSFKQSFIILFLSFVAFKLMKLPASVIRCLLYFYGGVFSAIAFNYFNTRNTKKIFDFFSIAFVLISPIIIFILSKYETKHLLSNYLKFYVPFFIYVFVSFVKVNPRFSKMIEISGNMTYSIYLIHFPVMLIIATFFSASGKPIPFYENNLFLFCIATVLIISYLVHYYFEVPARDYIRKKLTR